MTHDQIIWPSIDVLSAYLADLADEVLDDVSRAKYTADAKAILAFIQSEIVINQWTHGDDRS